MADRESDRLRTAAQCSVDAVLSAFKLKRVLFERFEILSQCCTDVVEREPDRLKTAAQCSVDAVESAFKLRRVLFERFETLSQ